MATSSKDDGYVDNWQTRKTVTECNLQMLTSEDCSDVTFRVGSEKHIVRTHRYVLVSRSCVFHAMFCGPLAEKGEVTIPDIETVVFKEFLRYLYTDTATLTADNVTGLLYTSRKYAVDALQDMCVTFLETSLSEDNVCQVLEHCHGYGETDLEQKALTILTEGGVKVVESPGFQKLCSDCLGKFLQSEKLNVKEDKLFEALWTWTKVKCENEGISLSPENLRNRLGELRYEIRFTGFPLDYLVNVVGPSGLLTEPERIRIMDRSVNKKVDISPFRNGPRKKKQKVAHQTDVRSRYVSRFSAIACGGRINLGKPEAVSFTVSKNISLLGCQLYGPMYKQESTYGLSILLYDDQDQVIAWPIQETARKLRGERRPNDIMFRDPVELVAGRTYTIGVTMSGVSTILGCNGLSTVTVDDAIFTFKGSNIFSKTTVDNGQIPGLIWK